MIELKISRRENKKFINSNWHCFEIDNTIKNLIKQKAEINKERDNLARGIMKRHGVSNWDSWSLNSNTRNFVVKLKGEAGGTGNV